MLGAAIEGAAIMELCEMGDRLILEETSKVYKKEKDMKKGEIPVDCLQTLQVVVEAYRIYQRRYMYNGCAMDVQRTCNGRATDVQRVTVQKEWHVNKKDRLFDVLREVGTTYKLFIASEDKFEPGSESVYHLQGVWLRPRLVASSDDLRFRSLPRLLSQLIAALFTSSASGSKRTASRSLKIPWKSLSHSL